MPTSVTTTELARRLGDLLARVRYRHESFIVERNGKPVAKLAPANEMTPPALSEALAAWTGAAPADPSFAADLERVGAADTPPRNPWAS
jgi:prevent-host-death family protein